MTSSTITHAPRPMLAAITAAMRSAYRSAMPRHELRRYVGAAVNIPTYCSVNELLMIAEESLDATQSPDATGKVLEIGSYLGASAVVLAETLRRTHPVGGTVYCIDTWMNDAMTEGSRDTFATFQHHTAPWARHIHPLRGGSADITLPSDIVMDLVFVDGDHSYDGAKQDVQRFQSFLATHGRLVLHDHRSKRGVTRVLGELLAAGQWEISRCVENIISLRPVRDVTSGSEGRNA